ncbi:MAG: hypothetical protein KA354_17830 [Phycisphaerae bacterium]|nr:hypothetical protein [Phycisphaerae bacterium]
MRLEKWLCMCCCLVVVSALGVSTARGDSGLYASTLDDTLASMRSSCGVYATANPPVVTATGAVEPTRCPVVETKCPTAETQCPTLNTICPTASG